MKSIDFSEVAREISRATNHPEGYVSKMYTGVTADMKRDALIIDLFRC